MNQPASSRLKGIDKMAATTASANSMLANTAPGFGSLLRSEWTRLRSVRSTWIILSLTIGLSIGFSATIALVTGLMFDSTSDGPYAEFGPIVSSMGGLLFLIILLTVLGVTAVTSDYASGMVRTTFIVTPQRTRVFFARATVVGLLGMAVSLIVIPAMFLVCQPIFGHYGLETASVTDHDAARYLILASPIHVALHTLIPFSFAWLLRGTASAITVSLGFTFVPWFIAPLLPLRIQEIVLRAFPELAKDSLLGVLQPGEATYLGDPAASLVIAVWVVGALAAAGIALNRRDV